MKLSVRRVTNGLLTYSLTVKIKGGFLQHNDYATNSGILTAHLQNLHFKVDDAFSFILVQGLHQ